MQSIRSMYRIFFWSSFVKQVLAKFEIDNYDEYTLAEYAGTNPEDGTSQKGIDDAFKTVGSKEGVKFTIFWESFSGLGETNAERFKKIGELICQEPVDVIIQSLYKGDWRHYETVRTIDVANEQVEVLNSLGDRSGEEFLGYKYGDLSKNMQIILNLVIH